MTMTKTMMMWRRKMTMMTIEGVAPLASAARRRKRESGRNEKHDPQPITNNHDEQRKKRKIAPFNKPANAREEKSLE